MEQRNVFRNSRSLSDPRDTGPDVVLHQIGENRYLFLHKRSVFRQGHGHGRFSRAQVDHVPLRAEERGGSGRILDDIRTRNDFLLRKFFQTVGRSAVADREEEHHESHPGDDPEDPARLFHRFVRFPSLAAQPAGTVSRDLVSLFKHVFRQDEVILVFPPFLHPPFSSLPAFSPGAPSSLLFLEV